MKDYKRVIALLSVATMLTACSETTVETEEKTLVPVEDTVAVETAEETEDPHPFTANLPEVNYNGYVFNIMGEIQSDHYDAEELTGEGINDAVYQRNLSVEEKYNIDLQYHLVMWSTGDEEISTSVKASDNAYDLATATHQYQGANLTSGNFRNWNEIPGVDLTSPYYLKYANDAFSIGEKTMLMFGDFMDSNINCAWVMLFNHELIEQYEITGLYDTVDAGEWTVDYFMSLVENIYQDTNGDGQRDADDFYGFYTDKQAAVDSFSRSFHLSAISKDERNYPYLNFYNESTVDAYNMLYKMYYGTEGIYAIEGAFTQLEDSFVKNLSVFSNCLIRSLNTVMREMEVDYGVLPTFKYYETDDVYWTHVDGNASSQMILVSQPEEYLERTGIITEALNAYSREVLNSAIYDVVLKTKVARDQDSARMLDYAMEGRTFTFDSLDESGFKLSPKNALRFNIRDGVENITSYYMSFEKSCNTWIDRMIKAYEKAK